MRAFNLAAGVLLAGIGSQAPAAEPQPMSVPVAAVWKQQKLEFHYFGRTSRYSCDGLRDKVRAMLLEMGVRKDLRVIAHGCEIGRITLNGMNPGLSIEFHSPVARGEANGQSSDDGGKPFEARYEPFNFRRDAFRNLNVGDCELVEEFMRQVIPKLQVRELKQDVTCVPYQQAGGQYRLSGEVLRPVISTEAARR
jgi:hypothetical protein